MGCVAIPGVEKVYAAVEVEFQTVHDDALSMTCPIGFKDTTNPSLRTAERGDAEEDEDEEEDEEGIGVFSPRTMRSINLWTPQRRRAATAKTRTIARTTYNVMSIENQLLTLP